MNCSDPGDEDQYEADDEVASENDVDDDREVDDEDEGADVAQDYRLFDWARKQFPRKTTFMLFAIAFSPASAVDLVQLRISKNDRTKALLYTAAFFVKEGLDWYLYRKALVVNRHVTPSELPNIYKKLERNAYSQLQFMKHRSKHVLEYLDGHNLLD